MKNQQLLYLSMITMMICLVACSFINAQPPHPDNNPQTINPSTEADDVLRRDAEAMALKLNISVDEAIRRLSYSDHISKLGVALEQQEADTFSGLWIQHQPTFRVVVAFIRDGEMAIDPYIKNTPLSDIVEVRTAAVSLVDLKTIQQNIIQLLGDIKLSTSTGINLEENQVEIYITDRSLFDMAIQEANIQLSEHIAVISIYEPLNDDIPFALTPDPAIHFPQLKAWSTTFMLALLEGELVVQDGCLNVKRDHDNSVLLIIWQPGYFVNNNAGIVEILDSNGEVVAKVGETIRLAGGEMNLTKNLIGQLQEPLPEQCEGPYWLMGELISN